ncbi:MAG: hypothetical protein K2X91_10295, partial [Thermoleophilia bacterium]|nr:hypothetical protein [Thermoleophilia bacterium]
LEGSMKGMDRALDALKSNIGDAAKKDENLRLLSDAERFCASAKAARPTDALNDAKDEAERSRLLTDFRRRLLAVLKTLIEAEEATMDGQTDKARAALEKVASMRDAAHKEFKVMDDADKPGEPPARTPPARRSGGENPPPQR